MATLLDGQFGMKKETTWNTPVTVDRFYEVDASTTHNLNPMRIAGQGLRVSSTVQRGARIYPGIGQGEITVKAEIQSKGFGVLFESIAGTAASTNVSGATYQQRFIPTMTTPFRPSYTIQVGVPRMDSSGTVDAYTYAGCMAQSFEIDAPEDGIPTISVTYWSAALATATGLATASYASSPLTYTDGSGNASTTFGGALTAASTTALASGGTSSTNIRAWTFTGDLGLNSRGRIGGWQQPVYGAPSYQLKFTQDYDATTTRALQIAQAGTSFTATYTGGALSTGNETFQLGIPQMFLDDNSFGQITDGSGSVPEPTFTVTDNLSDAPFAIVFRTADTAL